MAQVMEVLAPGSRPGSGLRKGLYRHRPWPQGLTWMGLKLSIGGFFARLRQHLHW